MKDQKARADRKEISESTLPNYYKPIKLFCEENNIMLNWRKISRRIPKGRKYADDRAPSKEEIILLLDYYDRRVPICVLIMTSSGARLGVFENLRWHQITPMYKDGLLVAAKIVIYPGSQEEYFSFTTPQCYNLIKAYMDFRALNGERITRTSPVIRDLFPPDKQGRGEPHLPKCISIDSIRRMVEDALKLKGFRPPLTEGKKRHEFQADHGFRKFFKTSCERKMKSLHVEMLLGHSTGLGDSYYRPDESELLESYLKAIDELTFSGSTTGDRKKDEATLKEASDLLAKFKDPRVQALINKALKQD